MNKRNYTGLSKEEVYLLSRAEYENERVITTRFAQKAFHDKNKTSKIIASLTKKRRLIRLEKGKYVPVPLKAPNQQWMPNEFALADSWMNGIPYYIGYFTMYNYWGFTEQVPQTVFVLNTKKSYKMTIGNIRYEARKIGKQRYYGIEKIKIDGQEVSISDKERTLVDFVYNPLGSFDNISVVLRENLDKIDLEKFIRYLIRFPVGAVRKRAGYLLEKIGCRDAAMKQLKKSIDDKNTYIVLDPANKTRNGKIDKEWKIIVNR